MMDKLEPNWPEIRQKFEMGVSIFEIGQLYELPPAEVRDRALKFSWVRGEDMKTEVKQRTFELANPTREAEASASEALARATAEIIQKQRHDVEALRALMVRCYQGLNRIIMGQPQPNDMRLINMRTGSVVDALDKVASAMAKLIVLQRQAYSMDEATQPNPEAVRATLEAVKTELAKRLGK